MSLDLVPLGADLTHTIPMALTENFAWIHATLPSHAAIMHRVSVERVMVSGAGDGAGFPQGELLGMSANLRTMANILSPLLWSRVYAAGVRSGKAGLFFCAPSAPPAATPCYPWADRALCAADTGITAVTLARLAIGRSLAADYGVA